MYAVYLSQSLDNFMEILWVKIRYNYAVLILNDIARGLAACISSGLSVEDTARACMESKVDIIVVQHQSSLRNILAIQHR